VLIRSRFPASVFGTSSQGFTNTGAKEHMSELEMIVGAKNIAATIGLPARRVYELAETGAMPTIKIGGSIAIRKTKLAQWIEQLEAQSIH
jgi:excisionase family DNA binding protein